MSEGNARARWSHTSAVLALIANVNRDATKRPRPFQPSDFDPHTTPEENKDVVRIDEDNRQNIGLLREAFAGIK